jgi:hypothetical protein
LRPTRFDRLRFAFLALLAVLVAAPGIHLFELWLNHRMPRGNQALIR